MLPLAPKWLEPPPLLGETRSADDDEEVEMEGGRAEKVAVVWGDKPLIGEATLYLLKGRPRPRRERDEEIHQPNTEYIRSAWVLVIVFTLHKEAENSRAEAEDEEVETFLHFLFNKTPSSAAIPELKCNNSPLVPLECK